MSDKRPSPSEAQPTLSRRTAFIGAGAVGALAATAAVMPKAVQPAAPQVSQLDAAPEGGGYRLTEHIKQYYASARI